MSQLLTGDGQMTKISGWIYREKSKEIGYQIDDVTMNGHTTQLYSRITEISTLENKGFKYHRYCIYGVTNSKMQQMPERKRRKQRLKVTDDFEVT